MYMPTTTWEQALLSLAHEAAHHVPATPAHSRPIRATALLQQAHRYCDQLTAVHSHSFHLASGLLPAGKRSAVRALYAFCRTSDDIVDCQGGDIEEALKRWQQHAFAPQPPEDDLVALAWADSRSRYHIPIRYAEQLIEGISRDLVQNRYRTFEELTTYCYGVASTVGLMAMHIIGFHHPDAVAYAVKLGLALQLTNILRDVGEDWQRGRFYLPLEELAAFGLTEADVAAGCGRAGVDDRWRNYMRFQIGRNRQLYAEAWPGIALLNQDGRFAIAAAAGLYRAILDEIEKQDYDVFNQRAHVSAVRKLRLLTGLWRNDAA